jgi:putative transposase
MPNFRRNYVPGATYFFTVVTHHRRPILTTELGRRCLRNAIEVVRERTPFDLFAFVLLPDHLHTVWVLPPNDSNYSTRWRRIKENFTRAYLRGGGKDGPMTLNRLRHQERAIWQHRFWEHTIRDEDDLVRCVDYVHLNPVKHGLSDSAIAYPWSSFARFVASGDYSPEWGTATTECPHIDGAEWDHPS